MFGNPRFAFSYLGAAIGFIKERPRANVQFITKVVLDIPFRPVRRYDNRFHRRAEVIMKEMPNVSDLVVRVNVEQNDWPFTFREPWVRLLLMFKAWPLKRIDVDIKSRLRAACRPSKLRYDLEVQAIESIHQLFEEAIMMRIMGHSEWDATRNYRNWAHRASNKLVTVLQSSIMTLRRRDMIEQSMDFSWVERDES
jgi:hypothetical protein